MDGFTKLLLFLGQQYYLYKRKIIFVEELRQIFSEKEITEILKDPLKQGWIQPVIDDLHFEITELAVASVLRHWNQNVYKTGEIGGGSLNINPANQGFTIIVIFDSPVKFVEHAKVSYDNHEIFLNCVEGFYYEAKVHTPTEDDLEDAEKTINKYLSHLSYYHKIPVTIKSTHSGSMDISNTTKRPESRKGIYLPIPTLLLLQENQARAVAFYRQFRNFYQIETTESRYYQLISLLKILEGVNPSANLAQNKTDFINLVNKYLSTLSGELQAKARGVESKYTAKHGHSLPFSDILWEHYRNGVAHWRARGIFLDPDIPDGFLATTINIVEQVVLLVLKNEFALT